METKTKKATFGAGCFWHVEYDFKNLDGVVKTTVGYMSADEEKSKDYPKPTYKEVSSDKTGYVEVCEVEYDPEEISYKKLLEEFWNMHNPTELDRQGPDVGTQYKSVIFYYDEKQKREAEESLKEEQKDYKDEIVTEIIHAKEFFRAEEYHQDYMDKKGPRGCSIKPFS